MLINGNLSFFALNGTFNAYVTAGASMGAESMEGEIGVFAMKFTCRRHGLLAAARVRRRS